MNARAEAFPLRAADIARALGGRRSGAGWLCRCPAHDDHDPSLGIVETKSGKVLVCCRAGCSQDAVIDALRRRGSWSRRPCNGSQRRAAPNPTADAITPRDPMTSWRNAAPFARGSAVDRYLKTRGIDLADGEASNLRFSPALWHWPTKTRWPAMLARVALAPDGVREGASLTTHQTFLEPGGPGKAPLGDKARLFAAGGKTAGGGVWFGGADPDREFIVAEGIESALSAMRLFHCAAGCAALSELGVRRLILPPEAHRVRVFADHDELGQGLAAARAAGRRWRAEGREVAVSIADSIGEDANDIWLKRQSP